MFHVLYPCLPDAMVYWCIHCAFLRLNPVVLAGFYLPGRAFDWVEKLIWRVTQESKRSSMEVDLLITGVITYNILVAMYCPLLYLLTTDAAAVVSEPWSHAKVYL